MMNVDVSFYAYCCAESGKGFNRGYLINNQPIAPGIAVSNSQINLGQSLSDALKWGNAKKLEANDLSELKFIEVSGNKCVELENLDIKRPDLDKLIRVFLACAD